MLEPHEWNVVVAGFWNRAILNPSGMAMRLFGLPEGTPVLVEVPLDGVGSLRVTNDDVTTTLAGTRLIVEAKVPSFPNLARAMSIACNGIRSLPETPFSAAGFNVRWRIGELPQSLLEMVQSDVDTRLSDRAFRISRRTLGRSLDWKSGRINLTVGVTTDGPCEILLNFERLSSQGADLIEWLRIPRQDVEQQATQMLDLLGLQEAAVDAGR
jgi:hypothetical protein